MCIYILIDWFSSFLEPCVRCTAKSVFLIFTVLPRFFALFYPDFIAFFTHRCILLLPAHLIVLQPHQEKAAKFAKVSGAKSFLFSL